MMINQTIDKLRSLRLTGMARALEEQLNLPDTSSLSFEERLGLIVDQEETLRLERRFKNRIRVAKLKQTACIEDLNFKSQREGITKSQILSFANCDWIKHHQDIIMIGPTGIGKSYIACALAHKACQYGFSAKYIRAPRLFQELLICKGDGSYAKFMDRLSKIDLLILDDWGIAPLTHQESRDLLEIVEDRHKTRSLIITSQIPLENWFEIIGDKTIADAVMDRIVNNSHKIIMRGPTMRKKDAIKEPLTNP
jgi:DNA replication protein DnaC